MLQMRKLLVLLVLLFFTGSLAHLKHRALPDFNFEGSLFADQAGYYIYLPFYFVYEGKTKQLDKGWSEKLGKGFKIENEKLFTKYPIGVALLQAPFFGIVHGYNVALGKSTDGFSGNYHQVPIMASAFYGSLGLWFFFLFAMRRASYKRALFVTFLTLCGTNVLMYIYSSPGMSHVYSLFLFSALLLLIDHNRERVKKPTLAYALAGLLIGLMVVCRPLNLLFVVFALAFFESHQRGFIKQFVVTSKLLLVIVFAIVPLLPQFYYWHYLSGNWIYYSYESEGFTNWASPQLIKTWFSPLNGLFPWAPVYLAMLVAMVQLFRRSKSTAAVFILSFLLLSYIISSWHIYSFGSGYGSRNFVEYSVFFAIPMLSFRFSSALRQKITSVVLLVLTLFSLKQMYSYGVYFPGGVWDWKTYANYSGRGIYHSSMDFGVINGEHSPTLKIKDPNSITNTLAPFKKADVSLKAELFTSHGSPGLVASFWSGDSLYSWNQADIRDKLEELGNESEFHTRFLFPKEFPREGVLKIHVWNTAGDSLKVSDVSVWLK